MSFLPKWQLPLAGANTGLTATGATQGTALALTQEVNVIGTVASGTGVILPSGQAGREFSAFNMGANTLNVYPPVGGTINALAVNAPFTVAAGQSGLFKYGAATAIYALATSGGASSGLISARATLTAGQSIPDTSPTVIAFNTVDADPLSGFTTGAGARYTFDRAGVAIIIARAYFEAPTSVNVRDLRITKNGTQLALHSSVNTASTGGTLGFFHEVVFTVSVVATDYVDARFVQQGSGSSQTLDGGSYSVLQINLFPL